MQARKVKHRSAGAAEDAAMDAALWGHLAEECGLDEAWQAQARELCLHARCARLQQQAWQGAAGQSSART